MSSTFVRFIIMLCITAFAVDAYAADYPPAPDFKRRVDYVRWYKDALPNVGGSDNAYSAYAAIMPHFIDSKVEEKQWPIFRGMLTTPVHEQPDVRVAQDGELEWPPGPGPWLPKLKSNWQASYENTNEMLHKFMKATERKKLVAPVTLNGGAEDKGNRLVFLKHHYVYPLQTCAKGVLENAWRVGDDGKVDAKALAQAIEADIRLGIQLADSLSSDELGTSYEVRRLAYQHIRWGFAHGVFNEQNANKLFKLLQDIDDQDCSAKPLALGQCATWLDAIQYVFSPFNAGDPNLNSSRFRDITGQSVGGSRFGIGAQLDRSPALEIADGILDAHKSMGSQLSVGYEADNHGTLLAVAERMRNANAITKALFMSGNYSLASAYGAAARAEAERRAARLITAIHAYKGARGDWPADLKDLGKRVQRDMMRDAYGNDQFVYMVDRGKPILYSAGINCKDDGGVPDEANGDIVFWPIPKAEPWVIACELLLLAPDQLTKLTELKPELKDKTIAVEGEVTSVLNEINPDHDRVYHVKLAEGSTYVEMYYYKDLNDRLQPHQKIENGMIIRARGTVVVEDGKAQLHLTDENQLVIVSK